MRRQDLPQTETTRALQAFEDYWDLGPGRSLAKLTQLYRERAAAGQTVPTRNQRQLEVWSSVFEWEDRVRNRMAQIAERKEAELAEERQQWAKQRLQEARALHSAGGAAVKELIDRIKAGALKDLPFMGYWSALEFSTETVEQDWETCPACGGTDSDCQRCGGSGRRYVGKGRRKVSAGTKIVKVDGLMDVAGIITKMIQIGQQLERIELGEGQKPEQWADAILAALPDHLRQEVAANLAAELARGNAREAGR